jgi:PKD repeat protein
MKKLLLILCLTITLGMLGMASAGNCTSNNITMHSPNEETTNNNSMLINWSLDSSCNTGFTFNVMYSNDSCSNPASTIISGLGSAVTDYTWDTTSFIDGLYCVSIYAIPFMGDIGGSNSSNITIDRTAPAFGISPVVIANGDELNVTSEINFTNATAATYYINWNDGSTVDNQSKEHNYSASGAYNVSVRLSDTVGNNRTSYVTVNVGNVAPSNVTITAANSSVVGKNISFVGSAEDVTNDTLTYYWNFSDGSAITTGNVTTHAFSAIGTYNVTLTVSDGTSNTTGNLTITISVPISLNQSGVVNDEVNFTFDGQLINLTACTLTEGASSLNVSNSSSNCTVTWNPLATENGSTEAVIQASNGTDTKLFYLNLTAYDWGIDLVAGWNLISIPTEVADSSIDVVFADILTNIDYNSSGYSVYNYDAVEGKWFKARRLSSGTGFSSTVSSKITQIVPGFAYWIKMNNSDTIYGMTKEYSVNELPIPSIILSTLSWNLIGTYGLNNTLLISDALGSLESNYFNDSILEYSNGVWSTLSGNMNKETGFWVRTKSVEGQTTIDYFPVVGYL